MRRHRPLVLALLLMLAALACPGLAAAAPAKHALLIGCTRYDHLPEAYHLTGPGNDVRLLRDFLISKFGFPKPNVTVLAEDAGGEENRPKRANIEREFKRLAQAAQRGDQVVILMAGHGSRQPQAHPDDPRKYEPDGLDEIFLPADADKWEQQIGKVANSIADYEIRDWLDAIRKKGASILIIIDACHSASMVRGTDEERLREVPMEKLVPENAVQKIKQQVKQHAEKTRGKPGKPAPFQISGDATDLVAIYAAQRTEPTVEKKLPMDSSAAKYYGLLTWTMVNVLSQAKSPMTYTELVQRIHAQYVQWDRNAPTPLVEGKDRHREFLGVREWPERSRILLGKASGDQGWMVNAGALQGLTPGTILAFLPPAGKGDKPVGHVKITRLGTLESLVEPCAHAGLPVAKSLAEGGRCQAVMVDYGSQRLRVAVDPGKAKASAELARLEKAMKGLDKAGSLVRPVPALKEADWLVRWQDGEAWLLPAAGVVQTQLAGKAGLFGPAPRDNSLQKWLEDRLTRVARVRNLLALATGSGGELSSPDIKVKLELLKFPDRSREAKPTVIQWGSQGLVVKPGDIIAFRVTNEGSETVDFTLLFIDSGYGISSFFPPPGTVTDNRLASGKSQITKKAVVTAKTLGQEHMLAVVVKAKTDQQPLDFGCLAQPTMERARGIKGSDTLDSPLGKLFQHAMYGQGKKRGLDKVDFDEYLLQAISWKTEKNQK